MRGWKIVAPGLVLAVLLCAMLTMPVSAQGTVIARTTEGESVDMTSEVGYTGEGDFTAISNCLATSKLLVTYYLAPYEDLLDSGCDVTFTYDYPYISVSITVPVTVGTE